MTTDSTGATFRIPTTTDPTTRIRITAEASRAIDAWAWGLADGTMQLAQLPDAICTLFNIAFEQGRQSREQEVQQHRLDADRLWLRLFAPKERQQYLLDRLDRAAEIATDAGNVETHLDEAWRLYCASLDNIREPITLHTTTQMKEVA